MHWIVKIENHFYTSKLQPISSVIIYSPSPKKLNFFNYEKPKKQGKTARRHFPLLTFSTQNVFVFLINHRIQFSECFKFQPQSCKSKQLKREKVNESFHTKNLYPIKCQVL